MKKSSLVFILALWVFSFLPTMLLIKYREDITWNRLQKSLDTVTADLAIVASEADRGESDLRCQIRLLQARCDQCCCCQKCDCKECTCCPACCGQGKCTCTDCKCCSKCCGQKACPCKRKAPPTGGPCPHKGSVEGLKTSERLQSIQIHKGVVWVEYVAKDGTVHEVTMLEDDYNKMCDSK